MTLDVKWDLLASNGGLGTVPKPDPFVPSREYDPPKQFEKYPNYRTDQP